MPSTAATREAKADTKAAAEAGGRLGLVTRGAIYLLVAALGLRIALGDRGGSGQAEPRGALGEVAERPFGWVLLVALACGFAGYAVWRAVRAVTGEERGDDPEPHQRLADLGRAAIHTGLLVSTIGLLRGDGGGGGGGVEQAWTARLMRLGWGRWVVAAGGVVLVGSGLWLAWRGLSERFREHLHRQPGGVMWLGVAGHVGRGLAFAFIGGFVVRAAVRFDPNEPIGLDAALRDLASSGWGSAVAAVVSLGLGAFGLFSMGEARDRRVLDQ